MEVFDELNRRVIGKFGTHPITFEPQTRTAYPVDGIFSESYREVDPGGVVISSRRPMLFLRRGDLDGLPTNRDHFTVKGERFRVVEVEPDEGGGVLVFLERRP